MRMLAMRSPNLVEGFDEVSAQCANFPRAIGCRAFRDGFFSVGNFCDARFAGLYTGSAYPAPDSRGLARHGQTDRGGGDRRERPTLLSKPMDRGKRIEKAAAKRSGKLGRTIGAAGASR